MKNKFALGYKSINELIYEEVPSSIDLKDAMLINTHYLIKKFLNNYSGVCEELLKISGEYCNIEGYVNSNSVIYACLTENNGFEDLEHEELEFLKSIMCAAWGVFKNHKSIDYVNERIETILLNNSPQLNVRVGLVELRVIENIMRYPQMVRAYANEIIDNIENSDYVYKTINKNSQAWLNSSDISFNLKQLMTNAGFYLPLKKEESYKNLENWSQKYLEGMTSGALISHGSCYPYLFNITKEINKEINFPKKYSRLPSTINFFKMLENKTVLILSPISHLMKEMVVSGRLNKIYEHTNINFNKIEFHFLSGYVSTYPNRPGYGWNETFELMLDSVYNLCEKKKIDVFIPSSGCYGIPLCSDTYNQLEITSIYIGNYIHHLMGIRQKTSEAWAKTNIVNEHLRIDSDLNKFPNMNKIDKGRYI